MHDDAEPRTPREALPSVGLTRRRIALLVAGLVALWLVGVFARQVGDAATAADRADGLRARNAAVARDIDSLQAELELIQRPEFVASMARGYTLGSSQEIPFTIDPNAPALPADAPGSIGIRPESEDRPLSPLESWLQALFGS
jgi:hypothetical protein